MAARMRTFAMPKFLRAYGLKGTGLMLQTGKNLNLQKHCFCALHRLCMEAFALRFLPEPVKGCVCSLNKNNVFVFTRACEGLRMEAFALQK
jgi:hypothetical protein